MPDAPPASRRALLRAREDDVLVALQRRTDHPAVRGTATGLSHLGEHAAAWLVLTGAGALLDRPRRGAWTRAGMAVFVAHALSVVLKRVARRTRPEDPRITVLVGTPSRWSMPSSHASSTTAAAVAVSGVLGSPVPLVLIPAMGLSRLVLGVHYPTDVLAGTAIGAGCGAVARWRRRPGHRP